MPSGLLDAHLRREHRRGLVSAPAGVAPPRRSGATFTTGRPRICGSCSQVRALMLQRAMSFPRLRGVASRTPTTSSSCSRRPRARGGCPAPGVPPPACAWSSPRPQGLLRHYVRPLVRPEVVPEPAGVARTLRASSPRTRRCPCACGSYSMAMREAGVEPPRRPCTRAGCSPVSYATRAISLSSPRPQGLLVGPVDRAGRRSHPRARGGCPVVATTEWATVVSSPRPRGLSGARRRPGEDPRVFPAPAGVVRRDFPPPCQEPRRPRARGGCSFSASPGMPQMLSSPRLRGLYRAAGRGAGDGDVVPVPAGVARG